MRCIYGWWLYFCKIIAGDIPSSKVYEDEEVLAFLDLSGYTRSYVSSSKNTLATLRDETSQLNYLHVSKVAKVEATQAKGMEYHQQHGRSFWQTVFTHIHIIPRYSIKMSLLFHLLNTSLIWTTSSSAETIKTVKEEAIWNSKSLYLQQELALATTW